MWEKLLRRLNRIERDRDGYELVRVEADTLYPKALDELRSAIQDGRTPDGALAISYRMALAVNSADVWAAAYEPPENCKEGTNQRILRGQLLEAARLWYTEKLHRSIDGRPMHLHILAERHSRWRL